RGESGKFNVSFYADKKLKIFVWSAKSLFLINGQKSSSIEILDLLIIA
ncbi:MAG: hypothetical protein K0S44_3241, partial [Bacteroidetes bacterium]|nr:hypothetical protein [Bacteroidota bacterium]